MRMNENDPNDSSKWMKYVMYFDKKICIQFFAILYIKSLLLAMPKSKKIVLIFLDDFSNSEKINFSCLLSLKKLVYLEFPHMEGFFE